MAKDGRVSSSGTDLRLGWKSLAQERNRKIEEEKARRASTIRSSQLAIRTKILYFG
jgi:hypothetical protein